MCMVSGIPYERITSVVTSRPAHCYSLGGMIFTIIKDDTLIAVFSILGKDIKYELLECRMWEYLLMPQLLF